MTTTNPGLQQPTPQIPPFAQKMTVARCVEHLMKKTFEKTYQDNLSTS